MSAEDEILGKTYALYALIRLSQMQEMAFDHRQSFYGKYLQERGEDLEAYES
ncbi:MAG: hypothetical protein ACLRWM_01035 [Streptococcus sp.]